MFFQVSPCLSEYYNSVSTNYYGENELYYDKPRETLKNSDNLGKKIKIFRFQKFEMFEIFQKLQMFQKFPKFQIFQKIQI